MPAPSATVDSGHCAPVVGFIGLGDQGAPMAVAIAERGFDLHVWARRPASLAPLDRVAHVAHDTASALAAAVDVLALCIGTDDDVLHLVERDVLPSLRPGGIVINHGTGTPANAARLAELCAGRGIAVLDAPVSGGRPAAEARSLTVLVGGPPEALAVADSILRSFATHVVHLGGAGTGQLAKLFNNALLMLNQAAIADLVELARNTDLAPAVLAEALKLGSADSRALRLMNTMVTRDTVAHLSHVEALDMELFDTAMRNAGIDSTAVTARGLSGAHRLGKTIEGLAA
jgi:3-hydroxyisobutyrate dehydrogenase-like beta-hydroxyacid dehydrogenase